MAAGKVEKLDPPAVVDSQPYSGHCEKTESEVPTYTPGPCGRLELARPLALAPESSHDVQGTGRQHKHFRFAVVKHEHLVIVDRESPVTPDPLL